MSGEGLSVPMAVLLLAGEMAGLGVLALPHSMIGTGPAGFILVIYFTINAIFVGQRLGLCWTMIERMFPEYRDECRHPYMIIAEKAGGTWVRHVTSVSICITLFGAGCVVIVLCGNFFQNIFESFNVNLSSCDWTVIVVVVFTPLCWLGSPKDFWWVAVGALGCTVIGSIMIMVKEATDTDPNTSNCHGQNFVPNHPSPKSPLDFGQAFSSIMFSFAGASTFPTIQADMRNREKFPTAAVYAMLILCAIYLPMSVVGWWLLGDKVGESVVDSLCDGPAKIMIEVLFLIHLISALPIILNPPFQFFEEVLKIPSSYKFKRALFRSGCMLGLLVISLSLPNFGAILDLIGATTITLLNFVFPPIFFLLLSKKYKSLNDISGDDMTTMGTISLPVKIYCWHLVIVCSIGGVIAFVSSIETISADLKSGEICWSLL